jgi:hypothetical protein
LLVDEAADGPRYVRFNISAMTEQLNLSPSFSFDGGVDQYAIAFYFKGSSYKNFLQS